MATSLTLAVNEKLALVTGLSAFIETEATHDVAHSTFVSEIEIFSARLYASNDGIRDIAVAPDGIMQFVYPYEENISVLGYEPARDQRPHVRAEVQRAIESREVVLSLPYELLQGGQGVIARQAVFVEGAYWGLANIVVDMSSLLVEAGVDPPPEGLVLALKDHSGQVFWGSESLFEETPVLHVIPLPESAWTLAVIPADGWGTQYQGGVWVSRILGALVGIAISVSVYLIIKRRERLALLVEQHTRSLRQSEEKYRGTLQSMEDLVFVLDRESRFVSVHAQESDLYFQPEDFLGKKIAEVMPEEIAEQYASALAQIEGNGTAEFEYNLKIPGGLRWYTARLSPMMEKDEHTGLVVVVRDISPRKQAELKLAQYMNRLEGMIADRTRELEEAQERLIRQESLVVLGELAGGVGHELRNPLGVISNAVYYLKLTSPEMDEKTMEYFGLIQSNTEDAVHIVNDLLDFARVNSVETARVSVPELIAGVLEQFPAPGNIVIGLDFPDDLPLAYVDSHHIKRVLGNLVSNAYQAMPQGGKLTIDSHGLAADESLPAGTYDRVSITITDTGCGISPENIKKIFEPLFTTRTRGIGLGLTICKKLIEANDGQIDVNSSVGRGTTFRLILPVREV